VAVVRRSGRGKSLFPPPFLSSADSSPPFPSSTKPASFIVAGVDGDGLSFCTLVAHYPLGVIPASFPLVCPFPCWSSPPSAARFSSRTHETYVFLHNILGHPPFRHRARRRPSFFPERVNAPPPLCPSRLLAARTNLASWQFQICGRRDQRIPFLPRPFFISPPFSFFWRGDAATFWPLPTAMSIPPSFFWSQPPPGEGQPELQGRISPSDFFFSGLPGCSPFSQAAGAHVLERGGRVGSFPSYFLVLGGS